MAQALASYGAKARIRQAVGNLGPYQSLALVAVPALIVEPMKLAAIAIAGEGHWFTGTAVIVAAYAGSLFGVERLFSLVKPKLLKLHWFARFWSRLIVIRYQLMPSRRTRPARAEWPQRGGKR